MTATEVEDSNLVQFAIREMEILGMGPDSEDENKWMFDAVVGMVREFSSQGHSGFSAGYCISLVEKLLRYQPLSPLTDDSDEWMHVAEAVAGQPDLWQCRRRPDAFSNDGGKTYYLVDEYAGNGHDLEVTPIYVTEHRNK